MAPSQGDRRFPRSSHLRRSKDFLRNRREGCRRYTDHFVVCVSAGPRDECRLGLVVSRKVGNAVQRNRVKRLVREVFRLNRHLMTPGRDVVVVARRGAAELDLERTAEELLACLRDPGA